MKALGRVRTGQVVSMMGFLIEKVGVPGFFSFLARTADAAFIDTRIIFAHFRLQLTEGQRFASDLGWLDQIGHPLVRDLTEAAFNAPIPIILGGHSLVAGSMWSLVDTLRFAEGQEQLPATYRTEIIVPGHPWLGRALREIKDFPGQLVGIQSGGVWREVPLPHSTLVGPGDRLYFKGNFQ